MSRLLTTTFFVISGIFHALGQEGNYPLTHYVPEIQHAEYFPHDIVQDRHGMIYIAYNKGIIRFDGNHWEQINTPAAVFTLFHYGDKIYTGGPAGFGLIKRGENTIWEYVALHDLDTVAHITDMVVHDGRLVGISENSLSVYDLRHKSYKRIDAPGKVLLEGLFEFKKKIYITNKRESFLFDNDSLKEGYSPWTSINIKFLSKAPGKDIYLAGTSDNNILLYNKTFNPVQWRVNDAEDLEYLKESEITDARWVSDTLVALSSLKGGVIFIEPYKGKVIRILNTQSGMPDNEIYGMAIDNTTSIWTAHEKGLTRISPYLPFRTFDKFPGLEGSIISVKRHNGQLYVGTSMGLFMLERVENIKKIALPAKSNPVEERKGFWKKIWPFSKKNTGRNAQLTRELQSVEYVFKKVKGISSKVFHLASVQDQLFVAGLDGLYEVDKLNTRKISDLPVSYFHYSRRRNQIYFSSYEGEVYRISPSGIPPSERIIRDQSEPVFYIFEDHRNQIYFCGVNTLYRMKAEELSATQPVAEINNPFYEGTYGYASGDSVFFLHKHASGSRANSYLLLDDKLTTFQDAPATNVIPGESGSLWVLRNNIWEKLGGTLENKLGQDLSIFKDATNISYDSEADGLWVVSSVNELFLLAGSDDRSMTIPNSAFLYDIFSEQTHWNPNSELTFDQEENQLTFVFSQAEFTQLIDLEYQYLVEGLHNSWNDWTAENQITFAFLPAGKYTLNVRTRNSLGQMETLAPIYFKVLAPYWKRPWFYLLEFAFIGLMLLISVRMKAMGYKYRLMSRLLALLTLIIIIELIQILAESKFETETSPVVEFVIQVIIAIIILPVEEILRKYIFKEKHVKVSDLFTLREQQRRKRRQIALDSVDESTPVEEPT
jgi:hypothetical protein